MGGHRRTLHHGPPATADMLMWRRFPHAEFCHPREEHLAPLFVCAGAAGTDAGEKVFHGTGRIAVSSYRFG